MAKKRVDYTPNSQIIAALRLLWLRSRERASAIKRDKNTCQICGSKGSVAKGREVKIEIHHLAPGDINWDRIIRVVRAELLCEPNMLITLCKEDHKKVHVDEKI
jgi:5-methylcytosine-specific restriction endonuclease McrA